MKIQVFALLLIVLICDGCAKDRRDLAHLYNDEKVRNEFLTTKAAFLTPPSAVVGDGYYIFYGSKHGGPAERLAEWKALQQAILDRILRDAKTESMNTFNSLSLEKAARNVGLDDARVDALLTESNITSLQYLLATHEMRKKMAVEFALMLSYRHLREEEESRLSRNNRR